MVLINLVKSIVQFCLADSANFEGTCSLRGTVNFRTSVELGAGKSITSPSIRAKDKGCFLFDLIFKPNLIFIQRRLAH